MAGGGKREGNFVTMNIFYQVQKDQTYSCNVL